ncbi:MAG: transcription-repair coupling factor [Alphaproteobacteria bacterium]|nr:transcription-repair coupling factor [Alphaproteobacteria bacterium]
MLAELVREARQASGQGLLHIARDEARMAALAESLAFFAPELELVSLPAWDCLPYDRVSPNAEVASRRMDTLCRLAEGAAPDLVLTTVNAAGQRLPTRDTVRAATFSAGVGDDIDSQALLAYLARNGYGRTGTVREPGEFAVRGGIIDIFPPGRAEPLRLDLFGDTLDGVRLFDPLSQLTSDRIQEFRLEPVSEVQLDTASIARYRAGYGARFGAAVGENDPLYQAVTAGRRQLGMEHWLPLFHEHLETLFDYLPGAPVSLDHLADEARLSRLETIADYYQARQAAARAGGEEGVVYRPLEPEALYLGEAEWQTLLAGRPVLTLAPFDEPDGLRVFTAGGRRGRDFAPERQRQEANLFDALAAHIAAQQAAGRRVMMACFSDGSRQRLAGLLADHGIAGGQAVDDWAGCLALPADVLGLAVLGLEHGFESAELCIIGEQDVLGDRLARPPKRSRRAENFITEAASLTPGDFVVHVDHGIGRFEGLSAVEVSGAPHDCLLLIYEGGDRLFIPVVNIEVISRYGSESAEVALDRLGGSAWQARKARAKKRIRDIADQLIAIAAARQLRQVEAIEPPAGLYEEFCARFPYHETEDQRTSIADVLADLASGRPMDRLVCGDVGFGKTEVALRAAFISVMNGRQVAIVAPTTLLVRQHYQTIRERFKGWPVEVGRLSRMVKGKEASATREGLEAGRIEIVVGTHALLGKNIKFKDLGLVVVDEEQHFGVTHKERLKELRSNVHVLTLSATPIPRTLHLALSGARELSLIASPPVDRLAIRTFTLPFDAVVVREAIMREHYRGGQTFYICPRISDIDEVLGFLKRQIPEVSVAVAHGRQKASDLDRVMNGFYEGAFDVLVATNIVESGLDIPTANTMIVHRADMFGLSQLYQLRGRIGRSKLRAYAYLTLPARRLPTPAAEKRLAVMQALDGLGAGFSLASHDLDIRGAGNVLGQEQSGHIREVGFELYQEMLEEAVAAARHDGGDGEGEEERWSPQINIGTSELIPEAYVADLDVRLGLYRRLSRLEERAEIDAFAAELIDRFGNLPEEVEHLLRIVAIKQLCRAAGVEKLEAGPRGATLNFRANEFANPAGLVAFIEDQVGTVKLRPDHKLVYMRSWPAADERLTGAQRLLVQLAEIAQE